MSDDKVRRLTFYRKLEDVIDYALMSVFLTMAAAGYLYLGYRAFTAGGAATVVFAILTILFVAMGVATHCRKRVNRLQAEILKEGKQ